MIGDRPASAPLKDWIQAGGGKATLVLTDVVRATVLLYGTSSISYMQAIHGHRERAKKLIESLDGRVIDMSGDAIFAGFHRVENAFRYARAIIGDTGDDKVHVRVGVHEGLVHATTDGLFGKTVHYAARVAQRGSDSELWASDAAKQALEGDAPELASRLPWQRFDGCELKGIPGQHTLWCLAKEPGETPPPGQD
jgi:class 3 adenylate cyclase